MDRERFEAARQRMLSGRTSMGIGTLGERSIHAVLKEYYGGGDESKEIKVGRFVADVVCEDGIVEIQTRQLFRLDKKLTALLSLCRVTVVHPLETKKVLITIDPETGELISRRSSPRRIGLWQGIAELYGIREHLTDDNLTVRLPSLSVEELRTPVKGRGRQKRKSKLDKLPLEMLDEWVFTCPEDYRRLLPDELPEEFTTEDFRKVCRTDRNTAGICVNVLARVGAVDEVGKSGRFKLYRIIK